MDTKHAYTAQNPKKNTVPAVSTQLAHQRRFSG
jgi:hypothetical protein